MKKSTKIILIILFVVICGMIFYFSSRDGDSSQFTSDSLLASFYPVYSLFGKLSLEDFVFKYKNLIREMAHFFEFFLLGGVVYIFVDAFVKKNAFQISLAFVTIFVVFDEVHQLFVPGRTAQISDAALDLFGAITAILVVNLIKMARYNKRLKSQ